jgi:hypothetical protein
MTRNRISVYPILPGIDRRSFKPLFITVKRSISNKTLGRCPWFHAVPAAGMGGGDHAQAPIDMVGPPLFSMLTNFIKLDNISITI